MTTENSCSLLSRLAVEYFIGDASENAEKKTFKSFELKLNKILKLTREEDDKLAIFRALSLLYLSDFDRSDAVIAELEDLIKSFSVSEDINVLLELAFVAVKIESEVLAADLLKKCSSMIQFEYSTCGFIGRKTKFQEKSIAVLMVDVQKVQPICEREDTNMPSNIQLDDETYLEVPEVCGFDDIPIGDLECTVLLINAWYIENFETRDDSAAEKIEAYLGKILKWSRSWVVARAALYLRSTKDMARQKFTERAVRQLGSLENEFYSNKTVNPFQAIYLPDICKLTKEYGFALGAISDFKTAGVKLESVGQYDQAAYCYINLGDNEKATELLHTELGNNPSNYQAICLLGDLEQKPEYYSKAFSLSNSSYFPALRALGLHQFKQENWQEAKHHFGLLSTNQPSAEQNWFYLGCCLMRLKEWERAAEAFNRVISLNHDHFQAWNNLAAIHMQSSNLELAQHSLKMSVKLDFDSWRLWDNLFRISLSLGDLFECVHAYQRLLELRGSEAGIQPFIQLINKLYDASQQNTNKPLVISLLRTMDCLIVWMDKSFILNDGYIWAKSEYSKLKDLFPENN